MKCEKCGATENVGVMTIAGEVSLNICEPCHDDEEGLREWLESELEEAVRSSPDFKQLPDGRWTTNDAGGAKKTVFKVRTPGGVYAEGQWEHREDIPARLPDRFEHYFDTAEYIEEVSV